VVALAGGLARIFQHGTKGHRSVWYLERLPARGGMLGSTVINQFEGHRFQREEDLFVRETTQNAIDNPKEGERGRGLQKPRIVFRLVRLVGAKKTRFLNITDLAELCDNESLLKKADKDNELKSIASGNSLSLLYIEDFNTTGLDGPIADPKSHWMRFNLHGDAQKLEEEMKIGSYGYGKSVLARAAGTRSFIVYTTIEPNSHDKHSRRLMGHTFQNLFETGGKAYSGRGWFCERNDAQGDPIPFADRKASDLAEELGFTKRGLDETGTSFLLIGTRPAEQQLSIASIRHAFETWWWPSLLDDRIDVEFWENGIQQDGPAPRLRSDLRPYIECKGKLDGGVSEDVKDVTFHPLDSKKLGSLGLILAADVSVFGERPHPKAPGPRRVARTRARSGMFTEYRDFGTDRRVAFVGYYCAHDDIDKAIKLSEPSAHDEWSPVSQRLTRVANGREIVEAVEDRTRVACYNFQRANSAARAPISERLPELERILGAAFESGRGTRLPPKPGPKKNEQRASVEFPGSSVLAPTLVYGKHTNKIDGNMRFALRSGYRKAAKLKIWLMLSVAEDASYTKGEPLHVEVTEEKSGAVLFKGTDPKFVLDLTPGQHVDIHVRSKDYPRHQTVLFNHGEEKRS
jgi:hypothetical protein